MILEDVPKGKNIYVFIDAANMWSVVQSVKKVINYEFLKKFLKAEISPKKLKVFYYEDYPQEGTRECSLDPKHKYFTFLKKGLGFTVRKKPLKRIINDDGAITEKGNIDVKLVIDAVHNIKNADIALFFSGDSDFLSLINYYKNIGKKAYVFSSKNNVSTELRTGAHGYFEMKDLEAIWGNDLRQKKRTP